MIDKQLAETLQTGKTLYYVTERGKIIRVRVSGQIKTWTTRPEEFKLPVKYGMYESGYLGFFRTSKYLDNVFFSDNRSRFYLNLRDACHHNPDAEVQQSLINEVGKYKVAYWQGKYHIEKNEMTASYHNAVGMFEPTDDEYDRINLIHNYGWWYLEPGTITVTNNDPNNVVSSLTMTIKKGRV